MRTILFRLAIAGLLGATLAVTAFAWRLSRGPIPLPFLEPHLERALSGIGPDLAARVDEAMLVWMERVPELRVRGVTLSRSDGAPVATLPWLSVRPSVRALVRGRLAIARIGVSGVRLRLARDAAGRVALAGGDGGDGSGAGVARLLAALAGRGGADDAAAHLVAARIGGAAVELEDAPSGSRWEASDVDLDVYRRDGGLAARVAGGLRLRSGAFAGLRELAMSLAGEAELSVAGDGRLANVSFRVDGRDGAVAFAGDEAPPLAVRELRAHGSFAAATRALAVRELRIATGSGGIASAVNATFAENGASVEATGELRSLRVDQLERLWPPALAPSAREWVRGNASRGTIPRGRFAIRLPAGDAGRLPDGALAIDFRFEDLRLRYAKGLEPLERLRGSGRLTERSLGIEVESGESGPLRVARGRMDSDLRGRPLRGVARVDVEAPVAALVAFLQQKPIDAPVVRGVRVEDASGSAGVDAEVRFPMAAGAGGIEVEATATLRDASMPLPVEGVKASPRAIAVRIGEGRVAVEGESGFTGIPGVSRPLRLSVVHVPEPGRVKGRLEATVDGDEAHAEAVATLGGGVLRVLDVPKLRLGRSELAARAVRHGDLYRVTIDGARLDLEPFLRRLRESGESATRFGGVGYEIGFRLGRVLGERDLELTRVEGTLHGRGVRFDRLRAAGRIHGGAATFDLEATDGTRRVRISSEDAAGILRALGIVEGGAGGRLLLVATIDDRDRVDGDIDVSDFQVKRAPVLARILSLASLGGIADMLGGEGIAFTRARIPFVRSGEVITIRDGRAIGSLGITFAGTIDRGSRRLDLSGSVVPAYTINSALGRVPLLGDLIVGGEGEGVFGVEYRATGSLDEPEVRVSPLSALAPGILRKMFVDPFLGERQKEGR